MSVNYYIYTRDINMVFDLMPRVELNKQKRAFEIHLCQSLPEAWKIKPLFECHSYSTFEELKEILLKKEYYFAIEAEYGVRYSPEEFISMMEKENRMGKSRKDGSEYDSKYLIDKDGFEFVDYDFC